MKPYHVSVVDSYTLGSPVERILAAAIDILVYSILHAGLIYAFGFLDLYWVGAAIAPFYLIFKDSFVILDRKSIGKKILNLRVIIYEDKRIRWFTSIQRNFIYFVFFLNAFGKDFIFVSGAVTFVLVLVEIYLMFTSDDNQRLGDYFANTLVIEDEKDE